MRIFILFIFIMFQTYVPNYLLSQNSEKITEDSILFEIKKGENNILTLILTNVGSRAIKIPVYPSNLNYIRVLNPTGALYAIDPTICTAEGALGSEILQPEESHFFTYNIHKKIFNPTYRGLSIFSSYSGNYTFTWVVFQKYETEINIWYDVE